MYMFSMIIERTTIRGLHRYRTFDEAEIAMSKFIAHFNDELGPLAFGYVHMA